jgi:glycosyltransferase involved in cell wall biosynthesis
LELFFQEYQPSNMMLLKKLPKEDYDRMVAACDVGMIFLDHRFTIPNFPSRLLSYMQAQLPVLACTDPNTDVGSVIVDGGFGWWCMSNDTAAFSEKVEAALAANLTAMGQNAYSYMQENYHVDSSFEAIMKHMTDV